MPIQTSFSPALIGIVAAGALVVALAADAAAQTKTVRIGFSEGVDTPHGQTLQVFKRHVEINTKNAIQVRLFPSLQLGPVVEELEGVKQGTQEMFISTPAWFNRFYAQVDVLSLPYLVTDWDGAERLLASDALRRIAADAEKASGIKILGVIPLGFRNAINKTRPITTLADLSGLKIRVQNSPVYLSMFRALKANPVTLDPSELFQAVQSGVIDGLETTLPIMVNAKYYQVAPFISETRHNFEVFLIYMNQKFYNGLSAEHKKAVDDAMRSAEVASVVIVRTSEMHAQRALVAAGAKFNEVPKDTVLAMQRAVQPTYDEFAPKFEPTLSELKKVIAGK